MPRNPAIFRVQLAAQAIGQRRQIVHALRRMGDAPVANILFGGVLKSMLT